MHYVSVAEKEIFKPEKSYIDFYQDLYKLYGSRLDDETCDQGGKLSYVNLCDAVLNQYIKRHDLNEVDILVPTYWSHEYNAIHTNCGPYIQETFDVDCDMFDIYEQGSISTFTSINILSQYLHNSSYHQGLMIALEQTTHPRSLIDHTILPTRNAACTVRLQVLTDAQISEIESTSLIQLIYATTFDSSRLYLEKRTALDYVLSLITDYVDDFSKLTLVLRKNTTLWKQTKMSKYVDHNILTKCKFEHYSPDPSMLTLLEYLSSIYANHKNNENSGTRYVVIVDEDIISFEVGVLILRFL